MPSGWESAVDQRSVIWQMYVFEINKQARDCKSACAATISLGDSYRTTGKIKPEELISIRENCERAVSGAASLRNLIFGGSVRDKRLKEFNKDRTAWMQNCLLKDLEFPTIKNVGVRDSIAHFDERLDSWAYESIHRNKKGGGWTAVFEGVFKSRSDMRLSEMRKPVRCYICDEMVFAIIDKEINIIGLMKEANKIIQRIRPQAAPHTASMLRSGVSPMTLIPL